MGCFTSKKIHVINEKKEDELDDEKINKYRE